MSKRRRAHWLSDGERAMFAFFAELLRDARGNTLAIVAFAMIPLTAMIGSAVDMSRAYTAQTRLQQACDAGALAGRRVMQGDVFTTTVQNEAKKFFNFNFAQSTFQTTAFTPTVTHPDVGVVGVTANTALPTAVMGLFGFKTLPISTTCTASQDFVNTDIVLVLDVTGSMDWKPDGTTCNSTCQKNGGSRLQGLQKAVMALYDELKPTQDQLTAAGMRLRYAVVPFSQTVNVGKLLYAANSTYIRNPANYEQQYCTGYNWYGSCNSWGYQPTSVTHTANWLTSWASTTDASQGCIEERQTVVIPTSATTAPVGAYDLDIDLIPNSDATRWAPYDPGAEQGESGTSCPSPATRLGVWARADLQTYINGLNPVGSTYHDIGLIWGGRMISANGVFADSPTTYKNLPVNKFVIFMTDGEMQPTMTTYSAYGVEKYDKRVTGNGNLSDSQLTNYHDARFSIVCDKVKQLGAKIIVVGFAQTLDNRRKNCASDGMAEYASDNAALVQVFQEIGQKIGALRLTN